VHTVAADVADAAKLEAALKALEAEKGPVDVAVCCAGLSVPKLFVDMPLEQARSVMQVPLFFLLYLDSHGARH
jgi:NAD(P)-dependent dehydrogenase (short-subunit alcohol dehydrogenase family)